MKKFSSFVLSVAVVAAGLSMTSGNARADLINGGFEDTLNVAGGNDAAHQNFVDYYAPGNAYAASKYNSRPASELAGWNVVSGSVDIVNTAATNYGWNAYSGSQSLDLNGWDAGTISQSFYVDVGQTVDLFFAYANNPWNGGAPTMDVTVGGNTYHYSHTGSTLSNMNWSFGQIQFIGTGLMTVTFSATSGGTGGVVLDAVSIPQARPSALVPEPSTMALAGLGLALCAFRRRRAASV